MTSLKRRLGTFFICSGFDPRRLVASLRFLPGYVRDLIIFKTKCRSSLYKQKLCIVPCLSDKYCASGVAQGHYFHQDLWAARKIHKRSPSQHVDIGSRIDGFIAHLLVFMSVDVFDIRELESHVSGLHFKQGDFTKPCSNINARYDSLSCLHAIEHFGLGRYGDEIDPDGWLVALNNFRTLLKKGGLMYLSVPIGKDCIEFNAQRIFSAELFIKVVSERGFALKSFSYVDDNGEFFENVCSIGLSDVVFGCGCFEFERK